MVSDQAAYLRIPNIPSLTGSDNWESWRLQIKVQLRASALMHLMRAAPDDLAPEEIQQRIRDESKALAMIVPVISPQIILDLSRQGWSPD